MQNYLRNAVIFLVAVFAFFVLLGLFSNAAQVLENANLLFLGAAALFYILSIVVWTISWAFLIEKRHKKGFKEALYAGFSSVYAALTPIQLGAETLRALFLKERIGLPFKDSVSCSMVVKGAKFLFIAFFSTLVIGFLLASNPSPLVFSALSSGFVVVLLATALFLLPLKKTFGLRIASAFGKLGSFFQPFKKLESFFQSYSSYLETMGKGSFAVVAILSALSLLFEFAALLFCFDAISLPIGLYPAALLFIIVSVIERTPFLPRGIGLVEATGFAYLSMPFASPLPLSAGKILALLIAFDFARLVVPSALSILFHLLFYSRRKTR